MEDLDAYAGDYHREEVTAEAIVRNIGAFSRFLEVAAHAHGEVINFANLASDAQAPASTVREYSGSSRTRSSPTKRDLKGLRALREENLCSDYLLVSMEPAPRVVDGLRILPWADFLDRLWDGTFLRGGGPGRRAPF